MSGPVAYSCPVCFHVLMRWDWSEHVKDCYYAARKAEKNANP